MTGQKVLLADFNLSKKSKVKLIDNSSLQAEGTSDIVIQRSNGGKDMIKDVLYVPGMNDPSNKPLVSYCINKETNEVEVEAISDIPVKVAADIPDTIEVEEGMANTSQRPQITRVRPIRLQDHEVTGEDEVTPDGELAHFSLLVSVDPINYSEALNDK
ncbi:hypothetical protein KIW84_041077 [Lathyrus oleraceus]|uniref:Retrovirus-related Pol polyprotein from transposon TNT 1-94-like beta-barrel domain-containing protein n=1 Tax=Pisum sativum TaxID=3888 RepID=A0A9D4X762_PEA|nr:hypothetical protein KIW84_041077 [Pisum sativum]